MRRFPFSHAQHVHTAYYYRQVSTGSNISDPFATDPVRRSAIVVAVCIAILLSAVVSNDELGTAILLSIGWVAGIALIFCVPILIWSAIEEVVAITRRRLHPPLEVLDLTPRVLHILHRHGFETIVSVDRVSDPHLMTLANIDMRDVQQIRRAISLWKYARWQEKGFPASEMP
ncbi:MAG: hypothetical protein WBA46_11745 [Thermomicrobiales bacterium]